jgi:hypothetical protein
VLFRITKHSKQLKYLSEDYRRNSAIVQWNTTQLLTWASSYNAWDYTVKWEKPGAKPMHSLQKSKLICTCAWDAHTVAGNISKRLAGQHQFIFGRELPAHTWRKAALLTIFFLTYLICIPWYMDYFKISE